MPKKILRTAVILTILTTTIPLKAQLYAPSGQVGSTVLGNNGSGIGINDPQDDLDITDVSGDQDAYIRFYKSLNAAPFSYMSRVGIEDGTLYLLQERLGYHISAKLNGSERFRMWGNGQSNGSNPVFGNVSFGNVPHLYGYQNAIRGPVSLLHLHENAKAVWQQFTNSATGFSGLNSGLRIGIGYASGSTPPDAEIFQGGNAHLNFSTNAIQRMTIQNTGTVGVNTASPNNRVEIDADPTDPSASGLRFTDLTSGSLPTFASNGKVLTVDGDGDVVLTTDLGGTGGISNACTTVNQLPMTANSNGDLACSQVYDLGTGVSVGNNSIPSDVRLNCETLTGSTTNDRCAIQGVSRNGKFTSGMRAHAYLDNHPNPSYFRVQGILATGNLMVNSATTMTFGGKFRGELHSHARGSEVYGTWSDVYMNTGSDVNKAVGSFANIRENVGAGTITNGAYAVQGICELGATRYGVYGETIGNEGYTGDGYGVYGYAHGPSGNNYSVYGAGGSGGGSNYAGYFNGAFVQTGGPFSSSDRRLKKDLNAMEGSLDRLLRLSPKTYMFDHTVHPGINLPEDRQFGFISQEMEKVIPELVETIHHPDSRDSDGKMIEKGFDYLGLNYTGLIPFLVGGIQEQQAIIDSQKERIDALENDMAELKKLITTTAGVVPAVMPKARLEQNAPNPFNENTVIRFYVPPTAKSATIDVNAADGSTWRSFNALTGNGQLVIGAGSMSEGTYTYSLVVDGERIDTRTMVITR